MAASEADVVDAILEKKVLKKLLVIRSNQSVAFVIPGDMATEETMVRDALAVPGYVSHWEIEDHEIPQDRTFRDALCVKDGKLDYDMDKCKQIRLKHIELEKLKASLEPKAMVVPDDMASLTLDELKNYQPKE